MSTANIPEPFTAFCREDLEEILRFVRRAARGVPVDASALEDDLLSVLYCTGTAHDGSQQSQWTWEAVAYVYRPANLAPGFRRVAEAPNPLDPSVLTGDLRPALKRQIDCRWTARWRREGRGTRASLDDVVWGDLSAADQQEIREMARHLVVWSQSEFPAHRPHKNKIETLLILLAGVFADHTGYKYDPDTLPNTPNGRFIGMASRALAPFFDPTEVSPVALGHRWKRHKKRAPLCAEPVKRRKQRPGPKRLTH